MRGLFFLFYFIGSNGVHMPGLARACGRGGTLFFGEPRIRRSPVSGELPPSVESRSFHVRLPRVRGREQGAEIIALISGALGLGPRKECAGEARRS